jgi:hypothetical protein
MSIFTRLWRWLRGAEQLEEMRAVASMLHDRVRSAEAYATALQNDIDRLHRQNIQAEFKIKDLEMRLCVKSSS